MYKRKWRSKQYCGDIEFDPYELAYRGSVFDSYSNFARLPTVLEHDCSPLEMDPLELIENIQFPAHRLSAKVRQQYLHYLEQLLQQNYRSWTMTSNHNDNPFSDDELRQCAETIEIRAVQACMITSLYREYVLKKIGEIRKQTADGLLHPNIVDVKFKPPPIKREQCHVGVQTDAIVGTPAKTHHNALKHTAPISLDKFFGKFESNRSIHEVKFTDGQDFDRKEPFGRATLALQPKLATENNLCATNVQQPNSASLDDEIIRELQAMFEPEDDTMNIFEWSEDQEQVRAIINEIQKCDPPKVTNNQHESSILATEPSPRLMNSYKLAEEVQMSAEGDDLRQSLWPCELHMQRVKLRSLLVKIADDDYRRYESLRTRFVSLFGEDDGEEQDLGPYSPSIELNDVLVASCRHRIAKWVVQELMRPLNEGLIANRYLFKKLAKRLAENIIYVNQYPDQKFIHRYIADYFCTHSCIRTIDDIT
ncbi:uncharacterized protein LOC128273955 [Anopheles cruzii]|uniref:uncharacterized protein LOC128273955 n=1 Tax=Anopheles cruzii TaxID=68878 RepID=UPI0022EC3F7D|nr:uncharacterized protein LOC128273955 [Anopheles cruzii]